MTACAGPPSGTLALVGCHATASIQARQDADRLLTESAHPALGAGASVGPLTHPAILTLQPTHRSACGRWRPGAVLQTPAPSNALHGVAAKTRVHSHVTELEHRPPHHPIGHVEGGATGHPFTHRADGAPGQVWPAGDGAAALHLLTFGTGDGDRLSNTELLLGSVPAAVVPPARRSRARPRLAGGKSGAPGVAPHTHHE